MTNFNTLGKIKYFLYLYSLIPIFLISGPLLSDISLSILSIFLLLIFIFKNSLIKINKIFFFGLVIFYLWLNITAMYSENNLVSLKSSILYIRFIFFIFAYDFIIKNLNNFSKINLNAISFCFIALFIDANFQYFYGSNILGFKAHLETSRISSFFGDEAIMGSFISKILPIFITLIFICYKKFNSILLFFIFFCTFWLVILSGERAAIAHLFIYSSIFLTLANFENKKKNINYSNYFCDYFNFVNCKF